MEAKTNLEDRDVSDTPLVFRTPSFVLTRWQERFIHSTLINRSAPLSPTLIRWQEHFTFLTYDHLFHASLSPTLNRRQENNNF